MAVALPKCVAITNHRLDMVYWLLMLAAITIVSFESISKRKWLLKYSIEDDLAFDAWWEFNSTYKSSAEEGVLTHCSSLKEYDYWSADGRLDKYSNYSCLPMCSAESTNQMTCAAGADHYLVDNMNMEMFAVTGIQEFDAAGGPVVNYFLPFPQAVALNVFASAAVPHYNWLTDSATADQETQIVDTRNNMMTVLLDANGKPWRHIQPGPAIVLSIQDLFVMSGSAVDFLDRPWLETKAPNVMPGAAASKYRYGPPPRATGVKIDLTFNILNDYDIPNLKIPDKFRDKPICFVTAKTNNDVWPRHEKQFFIWRHEQLLHVYRSLSGVSVAIKMKGTWNVFSSSAIILMITSSIILLAAPQKIFHFVVTRCLGQLSRLYREVLVQRYSMEDSMNGVALRVMANRSVFRSMQVQDGFDDEGISEACMKKELEYMLSKQIDFKVDETNDFLGYFFHTHEEVHMNELPERIPLDGFCAALAVGEPVKVSTYLGFFKRRSWFSPFERLFMPQRLRKYISRTRNRERQLDVSDASSQNVAEKNTSKADSKMEAGAVALPAEGSVPHSVKPQQSDSSNLADTVNNLQARFILLEEQTMKRLQQIEQRRSLDDLQIMSERLQELEERLVTHCKYSADVEAMMTAWREKINNDVYGVHSQALLEQERTMATFRQEVRDVLSGVQFETSSDLLLQAQQEPQDAQSSKACIPESAASQFSKTSLRGAPQIIDHARTETGLQEVRHVLSMHTDIFDISVSLMQKLSSQVAEMSKQVRLPEISETLQGAEAKSNASASEKQNIDLVNVRRALDNLREKIAAIGSILKERTTIETLHSAQRHPPTNDYVRR